MTMPDILSRLEKVKGSNNQYTACCPAHDDHRASLSISVGEDNRILLYCHAGCDVEDIVRAMGLQMKDLFPESWPGESPSTFRAPKRIVATYTYPNGAQKIRYADKSFIWQRPDGKGSWIWNRRGVPHSLYVTGELAGTVAVAEGEKDADNLCALGFDAVSGEDGAGPGKWRREYTQQLKGLCVVIFQDNDDIGRAFAHETAAALYEVCPQVKLLDLSRIWPEIPEHGDVSDFIDRFGNDRAAGMIAKLIQDTPDWKPQPPDGLRPPSREAGLPDGRPPAGADPLLSAFKTLDCFEEEEARWLVPGWIPEGQITIMAADGGVGKTSVWCDIIAALSNGTSCILDPPGYTRQTGSVCQTGSVRPPAKITFLTTEDSVKKKLRKKLRLSGANMKNIITPDFTENMELLHKLKFGTPELEKVLRHFHPALCVFDPVQSFVPPKINMGSRNDMRDCVAPLIALGEDTGITSIIVCHTNKRKGAFGRDRIADSADLWDIARSVIMAGFTEEQGVRYLSNEKNNYAPLQETILFTIDDDGRPRAAGTSWKRDREYMLDADLSKSAPKLEDCKGFILKMLDESGGSLPVKRLEEAARRAGYAHTTVRRAKETLKREGSARYFHTGSPKERVWHIQQIIPGPEPGWQQESGQQQFIEFHEDDPDNPWKDEALPDGLRLAAGLPPSESVKGTNIKET